MNTILQAESTVQRFFQLKAVRFLLSAGFATLIDVIIYFITFTFILEKQVTTFLNIRFTAHEFSLFISYSCGVLTNFLFTKFAVFSESNLASRKQFFRFVLIAGIGFFANYSLLRFFVEHWNFWPILARISSALSLGVASFYIHKLFTFKINS